MKVRKNRKASIRLNDRELMLLTEIAEAGNSSVSTVVRAFVNYALELILYENGNLKKDQLNAFRKSMQ